MQVIIDIPDEIISDWTRLGLITYELVELSIRNTVYNYLKNSMPPNKAYNKWLVDQFSQEYREKNISAIAATIRKGFKVVKDEKRKK